MVLVLLFIRAFHKTYPGFGFWIIGVVSNVVGQFALSILESNSASLLATLGSTLVVGMPIFCWYGLRLFMGLSASPKYLTAILLTTIALVLLTTLLGETLYGRRLLVSIIAAIFCLLAIIDVRLHMDKVVQGRSNLLQIGLALALLILIVRSGMILTHVLAPDPNHTLVNNQNEISVLGLTSIRLILVFALLLLNQQRLELELIEAKNELAINSKQFVDQLRMLNVDLNKTSRTDSLTGLANRRHFDDVLAKELQRHRRSGKPISVLLIDVDHFKLFNDTYGHGEGDTCLVAVANVLDELASRTSDLATRYGGEEFALILPETDIEGAVEVAQKLLENIRSLNYPHSASPVIPIVTVSVGLHSEVPTANTTKELLINAADQALYKAKESGRNQVYLSTQAIS